MGRTWFEPVRTLPSWHLVWFSIRQWAHHQFLPNPLKIKCSSITLLFHTLQTLILTFSLNISTYTAHPQNSYVIGTNLMFKSNAKAYIWNSSGVTKFLWARQRQEPWTECLQFHSSCYFSGYFSNFQNKRHYQITQCTIFQLQ